MNLNTFMAESINNLTSVALRYSLKNKKERRFITDLVPRIKKGIATREKIEKEGKHIPPFLIASISTQCNLSCSGCYARANGSCGTDVMSSEMNIHEWENIFSQSNELGISFILLAGGEPLIRKDIIHVASKFTSIVFPIFTNGTMIDENYMDVFDSHRNLIPILSLEGDRRVTDQRRGQGVFNILEDVMEQMKEKGILYGSSITVTTENMETVTSPQFVKELRKSGCGIIFYVEYVPVESGSEHLMLTDNLHSIFEDRVAIVKKKFKDIIILAFPGDEKKMGGCLAAGRGFFHINANGNSEPCPFSPYSDINLKNHSILEALESPLFMKLKEDGIMENEHKSGCVLFEHADIVSSIITNNENKPKKGC